MLGGAMDQSKGFAALEEMIEKDWMVMSICDFDQLLRQLEEDERITAAEHQSLIRQLAGK